MFKQFIIGVLSSATAHRLFPPPTNNGKPRSRGCILRLVGILILGGALCWALGYAIVVAPTYTLLALYAGLKYLATNGFIALDTLFHPGFDAPAPLVWGGWGLLGGAAIQGYREMQGTGRKGMRILTLLAPLLLLVLTGIIKNPNVPTFSDIKPTMTVEQKTSGSERKPIKQTQPTSTATNQTTNKSEKESIAHLDSVRVNANATNQTTNKSEKESIMRLDTVRVTAKQKVVPPPTPKRRNPERLTTRQNTATTSTTVPEPSTPLISSDMVLIPAGEFQMGSGENTDEQPVHTVYIDAFYMDTHEVTNAQYKKFLNANPLWRKNRIPSVYHDGDYLKHWNGNNYPTGKDQHPVTYVSWYAALAYAQWAGKRLPTEAEWEKAARGGLVDQRYPWGNSIDSTKANYNKNINDTTPVGAYASNGYGLYDMSGNVAEWCLDEYDEYFDERALPFVTTGRENPIAGGSLLSVTTNSTEVTTARVLRGGSWSVLPQAVRVADRAKGDPKHSYFGFGFRCVKPVSSNRN